MGWMQGEHKETNIRLVQFRSGQRAMDSAHAQQGYLINTHRVDDDGAPVKGNGNGRYYLQYEESHRADLQQALDDYAVRHIAARGWTMPDGTTPRIYLLTAESGKDAIGKEVCHRSSVRGRGERGAVRRWMAERIVADQNRTVSARRSPPGMTRVVRLRRGRRRTGVGR